MRELEISIEFALAKFREEKERAALEKTLLNLEKLGAMGSFAAGMIHDIRGPLTIVASVSESLGQLLENDPVVSSQPSLVNLIPKLCKHVCAMNEVVSSYRVLIENSDHEAIVSMSLREVCERTFDLCEYKALAQGVRFRELSGDGASCIFAGKSSLIQVLVNLISNSIDAVEKTQDAWIKLDWADEDPHYLKLRVIDSGPGIQPEVRDKLFKNCPLIIRNKKIKESDKSYQLA